MNNPTERRDLFQLAIALINLSVIIAASILIGILIGMSIA